MSTQPCIATKIIELVNSYKGGDQYVNPHFLTDLRDLIYNYYPNITEDMLDQMGETIYDMVDR